MTTSFKTDRERVNDLFSKLRKAGITAKQNFRCCSSCAGYELASNCAPLTPIVFYHGQDAEVWTHTARYGVRRRTERNDDLGGDRVLWLAWGYTNRSEYDTHATDEQSHALGLFIARTAHDCGLGVLWDGTFAQRIGLTAIEDDKYWSQKEELPAETIAAIAIDPTK
jgi:hypothetical protein